jgi:hypothetical protein
LARRTVLNEGGTQEIAQAILFLADEKRALYPGQALVVDGATARLSTGESRGGFRTRAWRRLLHNRG